MAELSQFFCWEPDYWHRPGVSLSTHTGQMGWHEFLAWRKAMKRLRDGPEPDPEHWGEDLARDPFWAEQERLRRERRGW